MAIVNPRQISVAYVVVYDQVSYKFKTVILSIMSFSFKVFIVASALMMMMMLVLCPALSYVTNFSTYTY
jgi:hypothetical protein